MIVEDEQIVALDLWAVLEDLGYEVAGHASSSEEAVTMALDLKPDLVLMDINLTGRFDGIDAARQIRLGTDSAVIFVSAYDDDATLLQAQITEPYGYILKPWQPRTLRVSIEMALFHHRMQRERERLTRELEAALKENKILQGLLSICAECKKIKDEEDHWLPVEGYLQTHSPVKFSHGLCPECYAKAVADLDEMTRGWK